MRIESLRIGTGVVLRRLPWLLVLASVGLGQSVVAAETRAGIEWLTVEAGFARAVEEQRAMCLVIPGPEADSFWGRLEDELLKTTSVTKRLQSFVPVVSNGPAPAVLREILGDVGREPVIVLLDFRSRILHRWVAQIPSRAEFAKQAKLALVENDQRASQLKTGAAALRKVRYALEVGKHREAVLLLFEAEALKLPAEDPIALDLKALRQQLEGEYQKRFEEANALAEKREYLEAIELLDALLREFPFPEREKSTRQEISRLWSLIRV